MGTQESPTRRSIVVVVNPERADDEATLLAELDGDVEVVRPTSPDDMYGEIERRAGSVDVIAVIGGDGSQRTAATALLGSSTALAVVPGGTVNLLGRVLGIDDIASAADAIAQGHTRTLDTGRLDGETFVLAAGSGFDAATMRRVDDGAKRWGRLGYVVSGLRALVRQHARPVTVTVDGDDAFTGKAMSVIVTNVPQRGSADLVLAHGGRPDDGQLDVVVQRCDTTWTLMRTAWALHRDRPPRTEDLLVVHGEHVEVRWDRPVDIQRDGDAVGTAATMRCEVVPASLTVCARPVAAAD